MARREEFARTMEKSALHVEAGGSRAAGKLAGTMRHMAENIRDFSLDKYKEQMMDTVDNARVEVDRNVDNVKTGIRDHPLESVAIAAGAGLLVGAALALLGRHAAKKATRT